MAEQTQGSGADSGTALDRGWRVGAGTWGESGLAGVQNRRSIYRVIRDSFVRWQGGQDRESARDFNGSREPAFGSTQPDSRGDSVFPGSTRAATPRRATSLRDGCDLRQFEE